MNKPTTVHAKAKHDTVFCLQTSYDFISRELSSVGRDIAYYMLGLGFEPRTPHFSTIKLCEL